MSKKDTEFQSREEEIRARMMRNAARIWGQPNASLDAFDPLVGMLLGACAVEVGKVYDDLESSQSRLLERLSSLLTPDVMRGPRAAHALAHARSVEPFTDISAEFQFFTQKRLPQRENSTREEFRQVFFTPSSQTRLFNGDVKFLAYDSSIYALERLNERVLLSEGRTGKRLSSGIEDTRSTPLYIGISIDKKLKSLEGMSFYFDWMYSSEKSLNYSALSYTRWFIGDQELDVKVGLPLKGKPLTAVEDFEMKVSNDLAQIEEREITATYGSRFVSVVNSPELDPGSMSPYPAEFTEVFSAQELKELKDPMLWIRVEFVSPRRDILKDIVCLINCFPLMSRHLNEFSYRLQSNANIIPLRIEGELFYSICAVFGSDKRQYVQHTGKDFAKTASGTYLLRQGGIERFDRRDASEMLNYLIDLLRDESASFSVFGNDLISSSLKELNQMINNLSQRIDFAEIEDERLTYLVVKPQSDLDNVFVEFWSTSGSFGNGIRSGTALTVFSGYDVKSESVQLVTGTSGGRDTPESAELLTHYRKALMTRGRVVTPSDIELFIRQADAEKLIRTIEIGRGIENNVSVKTGLTRTIEVKVFPGRIPEGFDWDGFCHDLEIKLRAESGAFYPIRVKPGGAA